MDEKGVDALWRSTVVEGGLLRGSSVGPHDPHLHRHLLRGDPSLLCQVSLCRKRGAQLPRSVLHHRNNLHGLVHHRGHSQVCLVSWQDRLLERLQEHRRCDGRSSLLLDALQRPVDHELRRRQDQRQPLLPSSYSSHQGLQADETLRRSPSPPAHVQGQSWGSWPFPRGSDGVSARLL